jgi:tetratricopeptide (TPR) repeat protein
VKPALLAWALCALLIAGAHAQEASDEAVERNNRGASLLQQGKLDEAIAQFRQAVELSPKYVTAHANLAYAYDRQGLLGEAIAAYQKVLELTPDNATARNNLGTVLSRAGRFDDAIREFEALLQRDPSNAAAKTNLENAKRNKGIVKERDDRTTGALKASEARPNDPRAAYEVARVYAMQGDHDKALTWLGKALDLGYDTLDFLNVDPAFAMLRKDPRYPKLLQDWRARTGR